MRLTPSRFGRTLASGALLFVGASCAEYPTEPAESQLGAPRRDIAILASGSGSATDTSLAPGGGSVATTDTAATEPSLLVCPTSEEASAQAIIGPSGGSVSARGTTLTVPAGAVPVPTLFEVVVPVSPYMETEIHAAGVEHYVFQAPATITINYARCSTGAFPSGAALQGVYVDRRTYKVLEEMGGVNDRSGHKLSFATWHLSGYIVAY